MSSIYDPASHYVEPFNLSSKLYQSLEKISHLKGNSRHTLKDDIEVVHRLEEDVNKSIRILRSFHNATIPIHSIPSEILGWIFKLTLNGYMENLMHGHWVSLEDDAELRPYREVYRLGHVSRYFRSVTLAYPSLWSTLSFYEKCPRRPYYDLYLKNSRGVLLTLHYCERPYIFTLREIVAGLGHETFQEIIQENPARIGALIMEPSQYIYHLRYLPHLPRLESLITPHEEKFVSNQNLFQLKSFACYRGEQIQTAIHNLTTLIVQGCSFKVDDKDAFGIDIIFFYGFLSHNPKLQVLNLQDIDLHLGEPEGPGDMEILPMALNQLKYLYFSTCDQTFIHHLFSHFTFNELGFQVHIKTSDITRLPVGVLDTDLTPVNISKYLSDPVVRIFVHDYISPSRPESPNHRNLDITLYTQHSSISVYMTVIHEYSKGSLQCGGKEIQQILGYPMRITTLEIKTSVLNTESEFFDFLDFFTSLSSLSIKHDTRPHWYRKDPFSSIPGLNSIAVKKIRLVTKDSHGVTSYSKIPLSPNLSTLIIDTAFFEDSDFVDHDNCCQSVIDLLKERYELGCHLDRLIFTSSMDCMETFGVLREKKVPGVGVIEVVARE
ncbi:hypothetical protein C8Q75DRAFT_895703 [Abortiporus biennis]|nr:hypothetical protein C8Q75DRAFT_895703 [Abortiporus biennis]